MILASSSEQAFSVYVILQQDNHQMSWLEIYPNSFSFSSGLIRMKTKKARLIGLFVRLNLDKIRKIRR